MKYVLISVGTRGDIEPFIVLAAMLKEQDHEVICMFPDQFKSLVDSRDLAFAGLGKEFIELIEGDDGQLVMGGKVSIYKKVLAGIRLYKKSGPINRNMVTRQYDLIKRENPDRIIFNGKSTYPFIWSISHPGKAVLVSPIPCLIHAVSDQPHVGFTMNMGKFLNRMTYALANRAYVSNIASTSKHLLNGVKVRKKAIGESLINTRMLYLVSPSIFPQNKDWPNHVRMLGFHMGSTPKNNEAPNQEVVNFVEKHPKLVLLTFGSMRNPDPVGTTSMLMDVLSKHRIPTLINTAAGGLVEPNSYDKELFCFTKTISYEWVLPKCYAVIHHGGSGTTQFTLQYGCACMIIPHIIDQFLWRDLVHKKGAGPKSPPINKLSTKRLEEAITELYHDPSHKSAAEEISKNMQNEDYKMELYNELTRELK